MNSSLLGTNGFYRTITPASIARLFIVISVSYLLSFPLYRDTFTTYYNREVIRLHTLDIRELSSRLSERLSYLLEIQDVITLQRELNENFGIFGFVLTDCAAPSGPCDTERILFTSSPDLPWKRFPRAADLSKSASIPIYGALPVEPASSGRGVLVPFYDESGRSVERPVLGRLYIINNLPQSFGEDFRNWLRSPFREMGPHRIYLKISLSVLILSIILWFSIELFLLNRRLQLEIARRRGEELRMAADSYLKQLEEKDSLITDVEQYALEQFETYAAKIRELERRVHDGSEFQLIAEELIRELEEEKSRQTDRYSREISVVRSEMEELRRKLVEYEHASESRKQELGKEMEEAFRPIFSNPFEKKVYDVIVGSPEAESGSWRFIPNFNVAVGRNFSQFVDLLVITPHCVVVVEAKRYPGLIEADGDIENTRWYHHNPARREIRCMWGLNPYHQINHYCMSVLTLINTRSRRRIPVYGILVFPDTADLSRLGSLGAFYRAVRLGELVEAVSSFVRGAGEGTDSPPPMSPEEIEAILTGRAGSKRR